MADVVAKYHRYEIPKYPHWFPYLRYSSGDLREKLGHLILLLTERPEIADLEFSREQIGDDRGLPIYRDYLLDKDARSGVAPVPMSVEAADALVEAWAAVESALANAYQGGLTKGRSLLAQLAAGEVRVSELTHREWTDSEP